MNKSRILAGAMAAALAVSGCMTAYGANGAVTSDEITEREQKNSDLSMELATQGMVLLQNKEAALPLAAEGNIAIFGPGAQRTVKGGTGSGDVNQRETVSVAEGFTNAGYNVTTTSYILAYEEAWHMRKHRSWRRRLQGTVSGVPPGRKRSRSRMI